MRRGTTPIHEFIVDTDLTEATKIYLTYSQYGRNVLELAYPDEDRITVTATKLTVKLTQQETLKFSDFPDVRMQIRALFSDGTAIACEVIEADVKEILKEGVITSE